MTPQPRTLPRRVLVAMAGCLALAASAQETPAQRHAMATNLLQRVAAEISTRCLEEISSLDDWNRQRPELRRQLLDMLGLDPLPPRTPLNARITGRLDRPGYVIEKVVLESLPGLIVTANLYLPRDVPQPMPAVLYLCGHDPHPQGAKVNYQDRASRFAMRGFACLILDTLEFGEVPGLHHGTHDLNLWHWLSLGYTPAGTEVWNAIRALDYLETRPEIDARRIGVTGISGGGAITWYTAAVDDRVSAAAPVCSTYTFGSQAAHWRAAGQCDCIYFHNAHRQDLPLVAALIAPRPLLILSGRKDGDFPPDGYREVFRRSKRVYDLLAGGDSDRIQERDADVGHSDIPEFREAARQWMVQWLHPVPPPLAPSSDPPPLESPADLACLDRLPTRAANFTIQHTLTRPVTPRAPRSRSEWARRRSDLLRQVRARVFGWFPDEPAPFETRESSNSGGWVRRYTDYREASLQTEVGARIRVQLLTPRAATTSDGPPTHGVPVLVYVKRPGDSIYAMDYDELLPLLGRAVILIVHPRFTETPISAAEYATLEMTSAWCGRTIAAMQTWDILRAIAWLKAEPAPTPSGTLTLYGKGTMGILALYAALLEDRVDQVLVSDPPASHWQGPALLNVLRVTDIPEVAAALAPRPLVTLTALPEPFALTRRVYRLHRTPSAWRQASSLAEAVLEPAQP